MRSNDPRFDRSVERIASPTCRAASLASSAVRSSPTLPIMNVPSSLIVPCPDTWTNRSTTTKGLYTPRGFGGGGNDSPSFRKRSSGVGFAFIISGDKNTQQHNTDKPNHRNDGFHNRPGLDRVLDAQIKIFLVHPKASVVDVRKHKTACADCQDH